MRIIKVVYTSIFTKKLNAGIVYLWLHMDMFNTLDFTPSADGTLDNMKYGGIDVPEIVQELKDNCDDAGSKKTDIYLLPRDSQDSKLAEFLIHDTGRGMNEENLGNSMKLAHRHKHTDSDIGKFGVGLKNATMGQYAPPPPPPPQQSQTQSQPQPQPEPQPEPEVYERKT